MINIYDVSAYIYAGMGTNYGAKAKYKGIPTGGIYNLMRAICSAIKQRDIIVLAFDSWTNAKQILPEYKNCRSRDPSVRFQVKLAYDYLKDIVPNCYKIEGYEADWIASSVFDEVVEEGKYRVAGYTVDADWAHNIVNPNTILLPASKNAFYVNIENFEQVFSTMKVRVPLNTISMFKVFFGDKSDNIPEICIPCKYTLADWFNIYITYCKNNNLDNRLKTTAQAFVKYISGLLPESTINELNARIEVIYPRKVIGRPPISFEEINTKSLTTLLSLTGCKSLASGLRIPFIADMGEVQETVKNQYLQEVGQTSKTRLFTETTTTDNLIIKDRGGFK